ncbi:MAG: hypothetical protein LBE35_04790 [Clostridiales bacterium]|jgi:hypothetical protein|nr:hypothetical protein [Clostridiales bacterium]
MRKAVIPLILAVLMLISATIPAKAVEFGDVAAVPAGFWALNTPYTNALNSGNSAAVVHYGRAIVDFWLAGQSMEARVAQWGADVLRYGFIVNNLWIVSNAVARHYGLLGNREGELWALRIALQFVDLYQALIPHIGGNPDDMEFARRRIQGEIDTLDVGIQVYAELWDGSGDAVYFGAPHEPRRGVFFGEPAYIAAFKANPTRASATMIYVEFEVDILAQRVSFDLAQNERMGFSRHDYSMIQIAWNFLNEGATPARVLQEGPKITEAARFLNAQGLPFLLRIGGEMNIWETPANPQEFIAAFRFIADIMRREAPNVAMAWVPNFISGAGLDFHMFYPGDDYVDWVGISLYTNRYFMGNPDTSAVDAAIFRTGEFANPVAFVRYVVENFGDRKPIFISEGGVQLHNRPNSEDLTDWALPRIRQTYAYIPMLFPQVKAMFWFNTYIHSSHFRYDFNASPAARALYVEMTALPHFIRQGQTEAQISYGRLGSATMPANAVTLLTYAPFFNLDGVIVQYWLNNEWLGEAHNVPYRAVFDLSGRADGDYALSVRALHEGRILQEVNFTLTKIGNFVSITDGGINVTIDGIRQNFEVPPQLIDDRTKVPLRAIAEALGMAVGHDPAANAAILTLGNVVVNHVIGTNTLSINGTISSFEDQRSLIVDGRTLMPVRMLAEAVGAQVEWNSARRTVEITTAP